MNRRVVMVVKVLVFVTIVIAGFGQAVLHLWNLLMPNIFGLPAITFWQAVGLMALSWILFGGWRGWGSGGRSRRWNREGWPRYQSLTPEQREELRARFGRGCRPQRTADETK